MSPGSDLDFTSARHLIEFGKCREGKTTILLQKQQAGAEADVGRHFRDSVTSGITSFPEEHITALELEVTGATDRSSFSQLPRFSSYREIAGFLPPFPKCCMPLIPGTKSFLHKSPHPNWDSVKLTCSVNLHIGMLTVQFFFLPFVPLRLH